MAESTTSGAAGEGKPGLGQASNPNASSVASDEMTVAEAHNSADFIELRRRFRAFAFPTTAIFLSWYLLYVIASGWARPFMITKVIGNVNVAFIFGLLQFASTFLIAILYARYADSKLDPLAAKLKKAIQGDRA